MCIYIINNAEKKQKQYQLTKENYKRGTSKYDLLKCENVCTKELATYII